ncbi:4-vinyl reductase [Candidatus Viridilinea mediisalina]|uniref:4-vinyl reductase n=1 Tax=Candidatus Viridilinea mediisalina TaxID=2024553 RepID=A0A2A6RN75_9CHLR|nr:4-vinyl reductase [Candidatus Viridilinea mediisalina]PDW04351.1 4-vinyl reductase [Candidatus Viridilinea mediisalina]
MSSIEDFRGLTYMNKIGHLYCLSLEEVMGANGVKAVLRLAGLPEYIEAYPPSDFKRSYPFEAQAATSQALHTMYGPRGARGLEMRAGRVAFNLGLREFGPLLSVSDLAMKLMPPSMKLKIILNAVTQVFDRFTDLNPHIKEDKGHFMYHITQCSNCLGRDPAPNFFLARGILEESTAWASAGKRFIVEQCTCMGQGAETCAFKIDKEPVE